MTAYRVPVVGDGDEIPYGPAVLPDRGTFYYDGILTCVVFCDEPIESIRAKAPRGIVVVELSRTDLKTDTTTDYPPADTRDILFNKGKR